MRLSDSQVSFLIHTIWNFGFLIIVCPVILFWIKLRINKRKIESKKQHEKELKEKLVRENSHSNKVCLNTDIELYTECKGLFNHLMKDGKMSRREILYLKGLINRLLGETILEHYKGFKFKNEANEIYVKLKNQYLESCDYQEILDYLKECERISENTKEEIV